MKTFYYIFVFFIAFSCTHAENSLEKSLKVERSLEAAGDNRIELQKVINYYKNRRDTLKLRAAYYLIEHMREQFYYVGEGIVSYRKVFSKMDSLFLEGYPIFHHTWDSIRRWDSPPGLNTVEAKFDVQELTANYLIKNIEGAFQAWGYPWAKNMSFEDFCTYLLPYKLANEEPDNWRELAQDNFRWILDSIVDPSPRNVCVSINDSIKKRFVINAKFDCEWDINYTDLNKLHTGKCSHGTQYAAYIMRAMGLPVVMDYTPFWANKDVGHEWNALVIDGKPLFFVGTESNLGKNKIMFTRPYWLRRKRAKVYRRTFSAQMNNLYFSSIDAADKPAHLNDCHFMDVTKQYVPVSDVSLQLRNVPDDAAFVYLCVFNRLSWQPIAFADIHQSTRITFRDVGRDVVYLPAYYKQGRTSAAGWPFILDKWGNVNYLNPHRSKTDSVVLLKKHPEDKSNNIEPGDRYQLFYWKDKWISLEVQQATTSSLVFRNVPKNALLWLRNMDRGKQERIFTYDSGNQIWW